VQRELPPLDGLTSNALIQYKEVNVIFSTSPTEGTTTKGRDIYVNEAQRDNYPTILTRPPSPLGMPIFFSEADALVVTMHIGCC